MSGGGSGSSILTLKQVCCGPVKPSFVLPAEMCCNCAVGCPDGRLIVQLMGLYLLPLPGPSVPFDSLCLSLSVSHSQLTPSFSFSFPPILLPLFFSLSSSSTQQSGFTCLYCINPNSITATWHANEAGAAGPMLSLLYCLRLHNSATKLRNVHV